MQTPSQLTHPDPRWQAILHRDKSHDGLFYYGVRSTRVFCRPSCPAKRPQMQSVVYFATPTQAQEAGYRACLRCKPLEADAAVQAVGKALQLLQERYPTPTLNQLAQAVGFSPHHLQRVFKRHVGLSPKQFSTALRYERFKNALKEGLNVTQALYEAGFNSARALYQKSSQTLGMTPQRYRQGGIGQQVLFGFSPSPLGNLMVAQTHLGVVAVRFGDPQDLLRELTLEFPNATLEHNPDAVQPTLQALLRQLQGQPQNWPVPACPTGSPFQQRVWQALAAIPFGQTRTYAQVAQMMGAPKAVRAVASACAANPVAILLPCHRVVRTDGSLSGYRWGRHLKQALLELEQAGIQPKTRAK